MTSTTSSFDLESFLAEEDFVRGLARSLLFDEHEVDDVVQQTWLQALKRPVNLPADGSPRSWLATVVRNLARNRHRTDARRELHEREAAVAEALPSTGELLAQQDVRRQVVEVVGSLPEPYRAMILLRYFEQMPPRQIALRTGVPKATVAVRLKRGLQMLRERLDVENAGDRRLWCLALVPVAVPSRTTVGVLTSKVATWLGVLMMMKSTLLTLSVLACLIALVVYWVSDPVPPVGIPVEAALSTKTVELGSLPVAQDEPAVAGSQRESVDATPDQETPESVKAAMAGFRGRLLRPDGTPAAGARVRILSVDPMTLFGADAAPMTELSTNIGPQRAEAECAEDGTFEVHGIWPRGMHALHAGVGSEYPLLQMLGRSPGPGQMVDLGTIRAVQKGVIEGQVVGDDGEPIAGAMVWAADVPGAVLAVAPVDRLTPEGGVFLSLPKLGPPQAPEMDAAAFHKRVRSHMAKTVVKSDRGADYVVLDLPAWGQDLLDYLPRVHATTGADGHFRLVGIESGDNVLVVRARGYLNGGKARVPVRVDRVRNVKIRLRRGNSMEGVVVDAKGVPVRGAELRAAYRPAIGLSGILFADRLVRTDAEGRFQLGDLPRGEAVVAVRRDADAGWLVLGLFATDDDGLEFELPAQTDFSLSVTKRNGDPIDAVSFELQAGPPLGEYARIGLLRRLPIEDRIEVNADGSYVFGQLEAGVYTVFARAAGYAMGCHVIRVGAESVSSNLVLEPTAALVVAVQKEDGRAVAGARVYLVHDDVPAWSRTYLHSYAGIDRWQRLPHLLGVTDAAGRLTSGDHAHGGATLIVRHPAYGVVDERVALPGETLVVFEAPGVIYGQLFDHGEPATAEKHRLIAVRDSQNATGAPQVTIQATLDEDGRFRFEGLTPGEYNVRRVDPIGDVQSLGKVIDNLGPTGFWFSSFRQEAVTVRPGEEHELLFDVDENRKAGRGGLQFSGTVRIGGRPANGYVWQVRYGNDPLAIIDANGSFLATGLKEKTLWLDLTDPARPGRTLWYGNIDLSKGADVSLDLDLELAQLRGRVLGYDGKPAPDHRVRLVGENLPINGRCSFKLATDSAGRIDVSVPVGEYMIFIAGAKGEGGQHSLVVTATATEHEWQLEAKGLISGRVDLTGASIKAVSWVGIHLRGDKRTGFDMQKCANGAFFFTSKEPGEYEVIIWDEDWQQYEARPSTVHVPEKGLVDLVLQVGTPIQK